MVHLSPSCCLIASVPLKASSRSTKSEPPLPSFSQPCTKLRDQKDTSVLENKMNITDKGKGQELCICNISQAFDQVVVAFQYWAWQYQAPAVPSLMNKHMMKHCSLPWIRTGISLQAHSQNVNYRWLRTFCACVYVRVCMHLCVEYVSGCVVLLDTLFALNCLLSKHSPHSSHSSHLRCPWLSSQIFCTFAKVILSIPEII